MKMAGFPSATQYTLPTVITVHLPDMIGIVGWETASLEVQ